MKFRIDLKPRAEKDIDAMDKKSAQHVLRRIRLLEDDLFGDVKRLKNFEPKYRLRVGDYRVLFNVVGTEIHIYRIVNRKEAY